MKGATCSNFKKKHWLLQNGLNFVLASKKRGIGINLVNFSSAQSRHISVLG